MEAFDSKCHWFCQTNEGALAELEDSGGIMWISIFHQKYDITLSRSTCGISHTTKRLDGSLTIGNFIQLLRF